MHDGIILLGAQAVGGAQYALEITVQYAKDRQQFDKPLGAFQALAHYLADAATTVDGAEVLVHEAAWARSEGRDVAKLAPMAKLYACRTFRDVTATAQQIFGGIGFTVEFDIQLYFRRAKQCRSRGGTPAISKSSWPRRCSTTEHPARGRCDPAGATGVFSPVPARCRRGIEIGKTATLRGRDARARRRQRRIRRRRRHGNQGCRNSATHAGARSVSIYAPDEGGRQCWRWLRQDGGDVAMKDEVSKKGTKKETKKWARRAVAAEAQVEERDRLLEEKDAVIRAKDDVIAAQAGEIVSLRKQAEPPRGDLLPPRPSTGMEPVRR